MKKIKSMKKMREYFADKTLRTATLFSVAVLLLGTVFYFGTGNSQAAAPAAGVLDGAGTSVTWVGTDIGGAAPNGEADCASNSATSNVCDTYVLTLTGDFTNKVARVQINWTLPATDYDMFVHTGSENGPIVAESASGTTTFEQVDLNPATLGATTFYIRVVYFTAVGAVDQYNGIASVAAVPPPFVPPASTCVLPTYDTFRPPSTVSGFDTAGEPSVGVNWNTGNILFQSGLNTLRATFNDSTSPGVPTWVNRSPTTTTSLDPIMFTDPVTGRTIPGQLLAAFGASQTAITDNDGETFQDNLTTGITSGVDHQSIGGGPYNQNPIDSNGNPSIIPVGPTTAYPHAFYYASQSIAAGFTARSDNGGFSYGLGVPMYNIVQCGGLHGHVKVAPDGTVYVPNKNCPDPDMNAATADGGQGVAVSEDNGLTWSVRTVPGSGSGDNDPAVGVGAGGRLYFAYTAGDKTIRAAVSDDNGRTFKFDQNIGLPFNIRASVFPAVVAGDNDRAVIFFHGTDSLDPDDPTGTDNEDVTAGDTSDDFEGTWFAYMATTCDGGQSWSVVRVGDPVQQGVICTNGTTCPGGTRNLLDFMDVKVDRFGRVIGAYADGCVTAGCTAITDNSASRTQNDGFDYAALIRQRGGSRLFSDFDAGGPAAPVLPPPVTIESSRLGNMLSWQTPDDNGSRLKTYKIYRGTGDQSPVLIGQVKADSNTFRDWTQRIKQRGDVYYQVTAVNGFGESPKTERFYAGKLSLRESGE